MDLTILIQSCLYFICLYIISIKIFNGLLNKKILFYLIIPVSVVLYISLRHYLRDEFGIVYWLLQIILIILLYISIKNIRFSSIFSAYVLLYSINLIITSLIINTFGTPEEYRIIVDLIVTFVISLICIIFCTTRISERIKNIISLTSIWVKRITLYSIVASDFVICLILERDYYQNPTNWNIVVKVSVSFLILFIGITFPLLVMNSVASSYHKNLSKNFKKQIEAQAEHYKKLAESNFELRRFRHDYKNINIGVSKLIECGNTTEALEMLNDYNEQIKSTTKSLIKFDTGNGIVDALLTEKQEKATTVNTVITFKGAIPSRLISSTDLCVIFGNTLDNAIEACEKIPLETEKEILIDCNCSCGFMFLTISNPVVENIKIHNNSIKTSKQDKRDHGFGLYSLKKIIQKYDGKLSLTCNNNLFHTKIELTLF